jgi:ATP-binding cassette subfamily B protein
LLVLDEATSALDNHTEAQVMRDLRENFEDTTVVMVAHRLSTTRYCDEILVLEHGVIVERGSYAQLMETSPRFRGMVEAASHGPENESASEIPEHPAAGEFEGMESAP